MTTPKILIGALSANKYADRRIACETTWAGNLPPGVDRVYIVGDRGSGPPVRDRDILRVPCPDDYGSLPAKTRWWCLWGLAHTDAEWFFKCDDDTYIHAARLAEFAATCASDYVGVPVRPGGLQYASGGGGYLLSRRAAQVIAAKKLGDGERFEDVATAKILAEAGIAFTPSYRFGINNQRRPQIDNDLITSHYCDRGWMEMIARGFEPMRIPKLFHHIWLGGKPLPAQFGAWRSGWVAKHPGWESRLWTDDNLPPMVNRTQFDAAKNPAQASDILRYELLQQSGGVYIDTDFECLKPIEPILGGLDGFAAEQDDTTIASGIMGAIPNHPLINEIVAALPTSMAKGGGQVTTTGPGLLTAHCRGRDDFKIFNRRWFYPIHYSGKRWGSMGEAFANHHWAHSWK